MIAELAMALAGLKAASGGVADATSLIENIKKVFSAPEVDITEAKQLSLELLNILIDTKTAQMAIQDELCPKVGDGLIKRHFEVEAIRL